MKAQHTSAPPHGKSHRSPHARRASATAPTASIGAIGMRGASMDAPIGATRDYALPGATRDYALIAAAIGCGAQDDGCRVGPLTLRDSGIVEQLGAGRHQARWFGEVLSTAQAAQTPEARRAQADEIARFSSGLARQVRDAVAAKCVPVVLGGDHSCAIGTWSGVIGAHAAWQQFGLLWIDAHLDSHTMESSDSGAIHGMPLAALLGHGDARLTGVDSNVRKLDPAHVVVYGARAYEAAEAELLNRLGVRVYDSAEIERRGVDETLAEALAIVSRAPAGYGITLDLDAFAPEDAPGVGSPEAGGLRRATLLPALRRHVDPRRLRGFELTEYNPQHDVGGQTADLARALLQTVLC